MGNKRAKQKKSKQNPKKKGQKGGAASMEEIGSPSPTRKSKKKR